jgi:3-hydroxyisobutyrate dehydrogenase
MHLEEHTRCWDALEAAAKNRNHAFRTPVLLSVDEDGYPSGRVMTLREANRELQYLRFHMDRRSPKYRHWQNNPVISAVFYDRSAKWQIRIRGVAQIHEDDSFSRLAWENSNPMCQRTYLSTAAPGQELDWDLESTYPPHLLAQRPSSEESELGYARFAVLLLRVADIDSLHLEGTGHQRFRIEAPSLETVRLAP